MHSAFLNLQKLYLLLPLLRLAFICISFLLMRIANHALRYETVLLAHCVALQLPVKQTNSIKFAIKSKAQKTRICCRYVCLCSNISFLRHHHSSIVDDYNFPCAMGTYQHILFCFVCRIYFTFSSYSLFKFHFGLCSAKYHHEAIIVFNDYTVKLPSSQV